MKLEGFKHANEFLRCLNNLDVAGIIKLHARVHPELPAISEREALYTLHLARTDCARVTLAARQYSHRWLAERGLGSLLDQRHFPRVGFERENSKRFYR